MKTAGVPVLVIAFSCSALAQDSGKAARDQLAAARKSLLAGRDGEAEVVLRKPASAEAKALRALLIHEDDVFARLAGQRVFDKAEAERLAKEAIPVLRSRTSDPLPAYLLGSLAARGIGMPRDEKLAFGLVKFAAEKGEPISINKLSYFYEAGIGTKPDTSKKIAFLRKAAEAGSTNAMLRLALCYEKGDGVKRGIGQSLYHVEKASAAGNPNAMLFCARVYEAWAAVRANGEDDPVADAIQKKAATILLEAAKAGNADAMAELADDAEDDGDFKESFEWRQRAFASGLPIPVAMLSRSHRLGVGCPKDDDQAKRLLTRAKELCRGDQEMIARVLAAHQSPLPFGVSLSTTEELAGDPASQPGSKPALGPDDGSEERARALGVEPAKRPSMRAAGRPQVPADAAIILTDIAIDRSTQAVTGLASIDGRLKNVSGRTLESVTVTVTLEDANGKFLGTTTGFLSPVSLPPGEIGTFKALDNHAGLAHVTLGITSRGDAVKWLDRTGMRVHPE